MIAHLSGAVPRRPVSPGRLPNNSRRTRNPPVCQVLQLQAQTESKVDIHSPYHLDEKQIRCYQESGFVRLPNVFNAATLAHYGPTVSLEVAHADKTPLEEDSDYQKAFTQVLLPCAQFLKHTLGASTQWTQCHLLQRNLFLHSVLHLQITNLWAKSKPVEEFVLGQKLGRIAAEIMGVRVYLAIAVQPSTLLSSTQLTFLHPVFIQRQVSQTAVSTRQPSSATSPVYLTNASSILPFLYWCTVALHTGGGRAGVS